MDVLRNICTASYRLSVLALLLVIASELAQQNRFIYAIGVMLFKVIGGPAS
jgi:hypothetical protein